jgi:hypothetical protein
MISPPVRARDYISLTIYFKGRVSDCCSCRSFADRFPLIKQIEQESNICIDAGDFTATHMLSDREPV